VKECIDYQEFNCGSQKEKEEVYGEKRITVALPEKKKAKDLSRGSDSPKRDRRCGWKTGKTRPKRGRGGELVS